MSYLVWTIEFPVCVHVVMSWCVCDTEIDGGSGTVSFTKIRLGTFKKDIK